MIKMITILVILASFIYPEAGKCSCDKVLQRPGKGPIVFVDSSANDKGASLMNSTALLTAIKASGISGTKTPEGQQYILSNVELTGEEQRWKQIFSYNCVFSDANGIRKDLAAYGGRQGQYVIRFLVRKLSALGIGEGVVAMDSTDFKAQGFSIKCTEADSGRIVCEATL